MKTATTTLLEFDKLQLSSLETIPNSLPADGSWTTPTSAAKTSMLDLEKLHSLVGPTSEVGFNSCTYRLSVNKI